MYVEQGRSVLAQCTGVLRVRAYRSSVDVFPPLDVQAVFPPRFVNLFDRLVCGLVLLTETFSGRVYFLKAAR